MNFISHISESLIQFRIAFIQFGVHRGILTLCFICMRYVGMVVNIWYVLSLWACFELILGLILID